MLMDCIRITNFNHSLYRCMLKYWPQPSKKHCPFSPLITSSWGNVLELLLPWSKWWRSKPQIRWNKPQIRRNKQTKIMLMHMQGWTWISSLMKKHKPMKHEVISLMLPSKEELKCISIWSYLWGACNSHRITFWYSEDQYAINYLLKRCWVMIDLQSLEPFV